MITSFIIEGWYDNSRNADGSYDERLCDAGVEISKMTTYGDGTKSFEVLANVTLVTRTIEVLAKIAMQKVNAEIDADPMVAMVKYIQMAQAEADANAEADRMHMEDLIHDARDIEMEVCAD